MDYAAIEQRITKSLGLQRRPVAVKFLDAPPAAIEKFTGTEPSGCSFWRLAAAGRTFYTVPSDHYNCPIGSYTHNIPLPVERAKELEQTLGLMVQIGYVKMEEVPGSPRVPRTPGAVVYSPLGNAPIEPDVAIFSGLASQVMILQEAAQRAGVAAQFPVLGRPTCMALPASMAQGSVVSSGCIGNRVYTGLGEGEMYVVVRAKDLPSLVREMDTVASANQQLEQYHRSRRESLASM
ncbi:MAG TPA: DUF169 domain-containing protein [Candidatus Acidoferrales bacterium]|nr:DUF169 domain-containing protein [Candidatus Acidoferrales bacterium]